MTVIYSIYRELQRLLIRAGSEKNKKIKKISKFNEPFHFLNHLIGVRRRKHLQIKL